LIVGRRSRRTTVTKRCYKALASPSQSKLFRNLRIPVKPGTDPPTFSRLYSAQRDWRHILTCLYLEFLSRFGEPAFEVIGQRRGAQCSSIAEVQRKTIQPISTLENTRSGG